jgi:hypothetical protein
MIIIDYLSQTHHDTWLFKISGNNSIDIELFINTICQPERMIYNNNNTDYGKMFLEQEQFICLISVVRYNWRGNLTHCYQYVEVKDLDIASWLRLQAV